jgi:hypothetical protein
MNKKAIYISLIYTILVIIFKLVILLGGFALSKFGFYYSTIIAVVCIIPFMFLAVYMVREKDYNGLIGGKEAVRIALTVLAVSTIFISVYNYIEFNWKFKDIAVVYYNGAEYLEILTKQQLKNPDKLKVSDFPKIIDDQIAQLSAFKATTGKLIPMLLFGLGGAFLTAISLKRNKI